MTAVLPASAAWRHVGEHDGFEVMFTRGDGGGRIQLDGHIAVVEEGEPCGLRYSLRLDHDWTTLSAHVVVSTAYGTRERRIERSDAGELIVDGAVASDLAGLTDVDIEGSAVTNALPVNRMNLDVGAEADAPAAYIRLPDLHVVRLDQSYRRIEDDGERSRYEYEAPEFDTRCVIVYDESGLVLDYPGIAVRVR